MFEDRISPRGPLPDLAPLKVQYALLCAQFLTALSQPKAALALARQLRKHMRGLVQASQQHFRRRQKVEMLYHPAWRERVIAELGGWKRLSRWSKRQQVIETAKLGQGRDKLYKPTAHPVSAEEAVRRAHMRDVMTANIHPRILRDPCRMDFEGWFRLPPQPRLTNPIADPDYEYDFDPRPKADFRGVKVPILIWPAEFTAAAALRPSVERDKEEGGDKEEVGEEQGEAEIVSPDLIRGPYRNSVSHERRANFTTGRQGMPAQGRDPLLGGKLILFFSRAPPKIRGSPRLTLRWAPLGGALSAAFPTHILPDFPNPSMKFL